MPVRPVRSLLARAICALAVMFFVFAPAMDALAKEEVWDQAPSFAERVLGAFDVVDDVLDHLPGHAPAVAQHRVQLPTPPLSVGSVAKPLSEAAIDFPAEAPVLMTGVVPSPPEPPPRG